MLTINTTGYFRILSRLWLYTTHNLMWQAHWSQPKQTIELQRGTRDYSWKAFQSSWSRYYELSVRQKTDAVTCNISTGNSTLFLPEHGRGIEIRRCLTGDEICGSPWRSIEKSRRVLLINMQVKYGPKGLWEV